MLVGLRISMLWWWLFIFYVGFTVFAAAWRALKRIEAVDLSRISVAFRVYMWWGSECDDRPRDVGPRAVNSVTMSLLNFSRLSWIFAWRGVFCQSAIKSAQLDTELLLHNMLAERDVPFLNTYSTYDNYRCIVLYLYIDQNCWVVVITCRRFTRSHWRQELRYPVPNTEIQYWYLFPIPGAPQAYQRSIRQAGTGHDSCVHEWLEKYWTWSRWNHEEGGIQTYLAVLWIFSRRWQWVDTFLILFVHWYHQWLHVNLCPTLADWTMMGRFLREVGGRC